VWVKRLSFLGRLDITKDIPFEKFVLDTRYTGNLLVLTIVVTLIGVSIYVLISLILKTKELWTFANLMKRVFVKRSFGTISLKEKEPVSSTPTETTA